MTTLWTAYLKFVQPDVSMAPSTLLVDCIRSSATEFLQITRFWHVATLAAAVSASAAAPRGITVTPPTGGKCWLPLWANFHLSSSTTDFTELVAKAPQELDSLAPGWRSSQDVKGVPAYFTMRGDAVIVPAPWPSADGTLDYDMSFVPTPDSTGCVDDLFNLYYETVAMGAVARAMLKPGQKWSNINEGAALMRTFQLRCADAATREDRGRTMAPISTTTEWR